MTDPVTQARQDAEAARARLFGTLAQVQDRLKPAHLAQEAIDGAKQGLASAARSGVETARQRPVAVAAAVGATGLFLARGWIGDLLFHRDETSSDDTGLKSKRARRASKGR